MLGVAGSAHAYQSGVSGTVIHSQIHNAAPWGHSTSYTQPTSGHLRVNNGPGWTETTQTYNYGQPLNSYELISSGSCTTAASGGPSGTGANITDGTCHWKYVGPVDYVTLTGWLFDNAPWTARTYTPGDFVRVGTKIYEFYPDNTACPGCGLGAGALPASCASTIAPSGTTNSGTDRNFAAGDGCKWHYHADIIWSSGVSFIPTATFVNTRTYTMAANYQGDLWNDREYVAGQNGEAATFLPTGHNPFGDGVFAVDGNPPCRVGCFRLIVSAAPGESFADRMTQYVPLTGYDQSQGVALRSSTGTALLPFDSYVDLIGLQIKSDVADAYNGFTIHSNFNSIQTCILEGSGTPYVVSFDAGASLLANSLVISHSQSGAVFSKYPMTMVHSTLVQPPGQSLPASVGVTNNGATTGGVLTEPLNGVAIFGFAHAAGWTNGGGAGNTFSASGSAHNATDSASTDAGTVVSPGLNNVSVAIVPVPGTSNLYSVSATQSFVSWQAVGSDYRLRGNSPLRGHNAAYGSFSAAGAASFSVDDLNLIRRQRPQAGRWDIGAW